MFRVTLTGDDVAAEARELEQRAEDLQPTAESVRAAVIQQNAGVNFDPDHPLSVLEVSGGSGAIGSEVERYADMLVVDDEEIADIEDAWIDRGET